ncbi:MAG: DUF190 domain-containing protein [Thermodesulfobacteriota bacterium]
MQLESTAKLLRIFIGEDDKHEGRPLYEVIIEEARKRNMAGATMLRGVMGFGANSRLHVAKVLRLSADLPIVIEIVDNPDRIDAFLPDLEYWIGEGLVTLEEITVVAYKHNYSPDPEEPDDEIG